MSTGEPSQPQFHAGWVSARLVGDTPKSDIDANQPPKAQVMDATQRRRIERLRAERLLYQRLRELWS
jgi:hypothetical protein